MGCLFSKSIRIWFWFWSTGYNSNIRKIRCSFLRQNPFSRLFLMKNILRIRNSCDWYFPHLINIFKINTNGYERIFYFLPRNRVDSAFFISIGHLFIGQVVKFCNSESKWISMARNCVTMPRLEWLKPLFLYDVSSWYYESTYHSDYHQISSSHTVPSRFRLQFFFVAWNIFDDQSKCDDGFQLHTLINWNPLYPFFN